MARHAPPDVVDRLRALVTPTGRGGSDVRDDLAPPDASVVAPAVEVRSPLRSWRPANGRAIALVLGLLLLLAAWWWWQGRPGPAVPAPAPIVTGAPLTGAQGAGESTASAPTGVTEVVVHVVGQVSRPGVVRLPAGARVMDAVRAAGGVRPDGRLGPVNLARTLVDGEQIVIGPAARRAASGASASVPAPPLVNLNSATSAELESLPGVGPVLAGRIIEWRTLHGPFTTVEALREVSGIGDAVFARLEPRVRV